MTHPAGRTGPVRTAAGLLYSLMHARRGGMVRPTDGTVVRSGGGDAEPRRVLLVGNGLAHGWGVASHRSAPTGRLAEAVAARIGGPCEVAFVGDAAMSVATAPLWLEGRADGSFHGAVVAVGANDALRLTPAREWAADLAALLDAVRRDLPAGAPVLVVAVPGQHAGERVQRMRAPFRLRARRLDAATRRVVAERPGTVLLPSPDLRAFEGEAPSTALYAAYADALADAVAAAVGPAPVQPVAVAAPEVFEHHEVRSVVEAAREDALHVLQEIVGRARTRFGVMESAVTLVDGDRTWHVVHSGKSPMQVPRSLTCCPVVTEADAPIVVENLKQDARFAGNAFLELQHARFYAGAPVHASDGTAIGALCLFHAFPRSSDLVDVPELEAFAREAEAAIRAVVASRAEAGASAAAR